MNFFFWFGQVLGSCLAQRSLMNSRHLWLQNQNKHIAPLSIRKTQHHNILLSGYSIMIQTGNLKK